MTTTRLSPGANLAAAVSSAEDGATLLLEPGHYPVAERLLIRSSITLAGYAGPDKTVLVAEEGSELIKAFGQGSSIVIRGLTLRGGVTDGGGAITVMNDCVTLVDDCVFEMNRGEQYSGGAILASARSRVEIVRSVFAGNQAPRGGAIALSESADGTVDRCIFTDNEADIGGAVYVEGAARLSLKSSTFHMNVAKHSHGGSAVFVKGIKGAGPAIDVVNCLFVGSKPLVNHPERPGTLTLSHSIAPSESLAECGVELGESVLQIAAELVEHRPRMFGLKPEVKGTGTASLEHIDADAADMLGKPMIHQGKADPGAIAAQA